MDGYRSEEWYRKGREQSIAFVEKELRDIDEEIQHQRDIGNELGERIWNKLREVEMSGYIYLLNRRYNLREIISEAKKRPEMAYIFDDPEDE